MLPFCCIFDKAEGIEQQMRINLRAKKILFCTQELVVQSFSLNCLFANSLFVFNKVDQEKTIQSKFKHCRKCILHISSMKDHLQRDHLNIVDGIKANYYEEEDNRK